MKFSPERKVFLFGILLILLFDLFSAAKEVYAANLLQDIPPYFMIFVCFLITAAYFNFIKVKNISSHWELIQKNWKDVFWLNVSTFGSWFGFFYAIKFIEPAVATTITIAVGPLLTVSVGHYLRPGSQVFRSEMVSSIGIFLSIVLLGLITYFGKSGMGELNKFHSLVGLLAAFICGISMVGNTFFGKRLNEKGWSAAQVMTVRFFILLIISGSLCWVHTDGIDLFFSNAMSLVLIAILGLIIPLYCLQLGIERTEPIIVSLVLSIVPLFTFLIQFMDRRLTSSIYSLSTIVLVLAFILFGILGRYRKLT